MLASAVLVLRLDHEWNVLARWDLGRCCAAGEWLLLGADGFGRIDVRAQIETDDGAFIYVQYFGLIQMNETVRAALAAGVDTTGTDFGDQYFSISPRFETGDERYGWPTQSVFVGQGRVYLGFGVEYNVHRLV